MRPPPLACAVRGCAQPLMRRERAWACPAGHSYDIARRGYVNLLQPQDRKAPEPGDSRAAVEARAGLLAAAVGRAVGEHVAHLIHDLALPPGAVVAELGAGTGDVLGLLAAAGPLTAVGIDLSTAAIEHAARRFPGVTWVVANADRRLPLLDRSVDVLLSLHARRHPEECSRVLSPAGRLVVAVPAPDDLVELRALVQGRGSERDRCAALVAEHEAAFVLDGRAVVRERHLLEREHLLRLLRSTYRGGRSSAAGKVEALGRLEVTLASDVCVFRLKDDTQAG